MKVDTVAELFAEYRAGAIHAEAPDIQVRECRRAFYAGAYMMLLDGLFKVGDESTSEEEGIAALEQMKREIEAFAVDQSLPLPAPAASILEPPPILEPSAYTIPDPQGIRDVLTELGQNIGTRLPAGWGYNLLLFEFGGPGGGLFYIANAERADVINVMRKWIARQIQ